MKDFVGTRVMNQNKLMTSACIVFLIGCASTQDEETFLQRLRSCDESSATISRVEINYNCSKLSCNASACGIKVCNPDQFEGTIQINEIEIDNGRCRAEFTAQ